MPPLSQRYIQSTTLAAKRQALHSILPSLLSQQKGRQAVRTSLFFDGLFTLFLPPKTQRQRAKPNMATGSGSVFRQRQRETGQQAIPFEKETESRIISEFHARKWKIQKQPGTDASFFAAAVAGRFAAAKAAANLEIENEIEIETEYVFEKELKRGGSGERTTTAHTAHG